MRLVIQRVASASVTVDGETIASMDRGLLVYVGFTDGDDAAVLERMADKLAGLRLFPEGEREFHLDVTAAGGNILLVPNFSLYASTARGRRPDFGAAMAAGVAESRFKQFLEMLQKRRPGAASGRFGADMRVESVNDGPVNLLLEA
ncbi:MAG: D-tyrosyl-tRNA(Tyr) deacylase [Gammaproteobacteria bacterium]|nr:D-tyrosyl-tRNA(Tyr) deacylase [Gammaproteobacteria bacterium]